MPGNGLQGSWIGGQGSIGGLPALGGLGSMGGLPGIGGLGSGIGGLQGIGGLGPVGGLPGNGGLGSGNGGPGPIGGSTNATDGPEHLNGLGGLGRKRRAFTLVELLNQK